MISDDVSAVIGLQGAMKFNGGGHLNHSIFWQNLTPGGSGEPEGDLKSAIERDFGSVDKMKEKLTAATVAVQGSGWGWLGYNKEAGRLQIAACANQVRSVYIFSFVRMVLFFLPKKFAFPNVTVLFQSFTFVLHVQAR